MPGAGGRQGQLAIKYVAAGAPEAIWAGRPPGLQAANLLLYDVAPSRHATAVLRNRLYPIIPVALTSYSKFKRYLCVL